MSRSIMAATLAALVLFSLSIVTTPVAAQEATKPIPRIESVRAAAYPLVHADPRETAGVLLTLFAEQDPPVRITSDGRTNTVIAFATDSVHRHIQELLVTIDREVVSEQGSEETRIIRVQHHSIDSLMQVGALHRLEIALGRATNSFIVRGRAAEIDRFAATIAALDVDTPALELEGWVLEQGRGAPLEKHPDLSPLSAELARSGLEGYGATSRWSVRCLAGEQFSSTQQFDGRRLDRLAVEGAVRLVDEGRNAQISIEVELRVMLEEPTLERSQPQRGTFEVRTTLETQPGKLVVIGLAPTGDDKSQPMVLVVRVKP